MIQKKFANFGAAEHFHLWSEFMIHGTFYLIFVSEINMFPFPFAGILKAEVSVVSASIFINYNYMIH